MRRLRECLRSFVNRPSHTFFVGKWFITKEHLAAEKVTASTGFLGLKKVDKLIHNGNSNFHPSLASNLLNLHRSPLKHTGVYVLPICLYDTYVLHNAEYSRYTISNILGTQSRLFSPRKP